MARAEELVRLLNMAHQFVDGNPSRNHIDGLEHSLRVATLARRWCGTVNWDPKSQEKVTDQIVFTALVHDLARPLSDPFHGEVIAEIVRDMVEPVFYEVLRTHGEYQAAYIHKSISYIKEPKAYWRAVAQDLCAWEVGSFVKEWAGPEIMTKTEAVTLIYKICDGRM